VAPFRRGSAALQILVHPDRFARPVRLREIRVLNASGPALLCGVVALVTYAIATTVLGG
jgi:hypothetical protein